MGSGESCFACEVCGKQYPWRPTIAGRKARCACGQVIDIPEGAPAPVARTTRSNAAIAAPEQSRAADAVPLHVQLAAERIRKRAASEKRERDEDRTSLQSESTVRDLIFPPLLIAAGIAMLFVEAMLTGKPVAATVSDAVPRVFVWGLLKTVLVLGGILMAVQFLEVSFPGTMILNILKVCAVAIGPAALKGMMLHWIGDLGGSVAGVFASIVVYIVLFKGLLRASARDTSICVVVTFVMITVADYFAYKFQSYSRGSWM